MKKFVKGSLAIVGLMSLGITNASAKTMTTADINNIAKTKVGDLEIYKTAYIFGKHVYMDTINMADVVAGAGTLEGETNPTLYYKNGENNWTNAITNETIANSDKLSFEMVKLVGTKEGSHISTNSDLYNDGTYVTEESYIGGRTAEIFVDEKASLSISKVELIKDKTLNTTEATYTNMYNASVTNVTYNRSSINVEATAPLQEYSIDNKAGKWVGLLVTTSKETNKNDLLQSTTAMIVNEVSKNSFEIWMDIDNVSSLAVQEDKGGTLSVSQNINVNFNEPKTSYTYDTKTRPTTINVLTENAKYVVAQTDAYDYRVIFYSDKELDAIEFTEDNNKKVINSTNVYDLIEVSKPTKTAKKENIADNADYNFNQDGFEVTGLREATEKENTDENIDYVVTLTRNSVLKTSKTIDLDMNLSAQVTITGTGVAYNANTDDNTKGTLTLTLNNAKNEEFVATITNSKLGTDVKTVKFVVEDKVAAFNINSVAISKNVGDYTINNSKLESAKLTPVSEKVTTAVVDIQANDTQFNVNNSNEYYTLLVSFDGVQAKDIDVSGATVITDNTSAYGAGANQLVIALDATSATNTVTFTNKNTNKATNVTFNMNKVEFARAELVDGGDNITSATIIGEDANKVKLVANYKPTQDDKAEYYFRINKGVTSFRATVDGKEYTFSYTAGSNKVTTVQNVVVKAYDKIADSAVYNQGAVNTLSFDSTTNTLNVELKATLDSTNAFKVKLELDRQVTEQTGILTEIGDKTDKKYEYELVVTDDADHETTYEIVSAANANQKINITVKVTEPKTNSSYLKLTDVKALNLGLDSKVPPMVKLNNRDLTVTKEVTKDDDKKEYTLITSVKPLNHMVDIDNNASATSGKMVGLLINLGSKNMVIADADKTAYGAKLEFVGENDVSYGQTGTLAILWLDATKLSEDTLIPITFNNTNESNKYDKLTLNFMYTKEVAPIKVKTVSAGSYANGIATTNESFSKVQSNFTTKYVEKDKTITITEKARPEAADMYKINIDANTTTADGKWYAVLVDLGINSNEIDLKSTGVVLDRTNAKALGATSNTAFVIWVNTIGSVPSTIELESNYTGATISLNLAKDVATN